MACQSSQIAETQSIIDGLSPPRGTIVEQGGAYDGADIACRLLSTMLHGMSHATGFASRHAAEKVKIKVKASDKERIYAGGVKTDRWVANEVVGMADSAMKGVTQRRIIASFQSISHPRIPGGLC